MDKRDVYILYQKLKHIIKDVFIVNGIRVDWFPGKYNFGDVLNPILLQYLTNHKIVNVRTNYYNKEHLIAIGSILDRATKHSLVWGSGYISEESIYLEKPKKIYAVRGPLTRKKLLNQGVNCPKVFGDPALLMPRYYQPKKGKKYRLGVLPHFKDKQ